MNKINLIELLKDWPKGMELDCIICNDTVILEGIAGEDSSYPIRVVCKDGFHHSLTKFGEVYAHETAKCVIFPKGKTTWEGFVSPCKFKDGDIIYVKDIYNQGWCSIYSETTSSMLYSYVDLDLHTLKIDKGTARALSMCCDILEQRLATEEEKQKLFDAIKANGYKWNAKTKTLEKLITRNKFQIGAKITNGKIIGKIRSRDVDSYQLEDGTYVFFNEVHKWELAPNKFDISTLKPFDKVLTRDNESQIWRAELFSFYYNDTEDYHYQLVGCFSSRYCIPYEGNEHLLGTTNDCDEYYKTWE